MRIVVAYISILLVTACLPIASNPIKHDKSKHTLTGITNDGIDSYLGIKYASAKRWSLPEINSAWTSQAPFNQMGTKCPQIGQESVSEDCLFLNVFAPSSVAVAAKLPVLLWIHGGGFKAGSGDNGPKLWALDDIIVVTFNYRLGLLGFFDHPDWSIEHPRNFGQADMVAALKWVKTNIALFGGDADNLTIAGHSAGAMGVQLMMLDPRAQGQFTKAISHAGYGNWPFPDIRKLPNNTLHNDFLIDKNTPVSNLVSLTPYYHLPYVGGFEIPEQPSALFKAGQQSDVPYLSGFNSYDGQSTLAGAGYSVDTIIFEIENDLILRRLYAADLEVNNEQAAKRFFGDLRYGVSARFTAEAMANLGQPSFLFYYDGRKENEAGAAHGRQYSEMFGKDFFAQKSYYLNFIKTGSPNDGQLPFWGSYSEKNPSWMTFDPKPIPEKMVLDTRLKYLEYRYETRVISPTLSEIEE